MRLKPISPCKKNNVNSLFLHYSVPTIYPLDMYAHLCMVDTLERLGIDRHFKQEIKSVLDETYR